MEAAFAASAAFFELPAEAKQALLATPATNNRGWTPLGEETLDPARQSRGDTKEGYYIGREVAAGSAEAALPLHGPNVWPPDALLPGWRATMERYAAACRELGMRLTRLLARALHLEPGFFDAPGRFDKPQYFLRLLRYSAEASAPAEGVFGAGAHCDYGMWTLLATDDNPGLQIQPRVGGADGPWLDVPPRRGAFIVNLGDMLERWTNGVCLSTRHRVVNAAGRQRLSMPFFFGAQRIGACRRGKNARAGNLCLHVPCSLFLSPFWAACMLELTPPGRRHRTAEPNFNCVVEPLPQCCSAERPARYGAITAGEYLLSRYADTHAAYGGKPRLDGGDSGAA